MQNKIRQIKYLILFAILICINTNCSAVEKDINADSTVKVQISAQSSDNYYGPTAEIEKLFRQSFDNTPNIRYTIVPRGLVVSIESTIFFEYGQDEILESSKPILTEIAQILKSLNNDCIIEGNTGIDTFQTSGYKSNWELSMARADKIADYLIKIENVTPDRIKSIGFGELKPMPSNTGIINDRIDFIIINYEPIKPIN